MCAHKPLDMEYTPLFYRVVFFLSKFICIKLTKVVHFRCIKKVNVVKGKKWTLFFTLMFIGYALISPVLVQADESNTANNVDVEGTVEK